MLKFPTIIVLLSVSPFLLVNILFLYLSTLKVGAHIITNFISTSWINLYHYLMSSFFLYFILSFNVYFVLYDIATLALFSLPFLWTICMHLSLCVCLRSDVSLIAAYRWILLVYSFSHQYIFCLEHFLNLHLRWSLINMNLLPSKSVSWDTGSPLFIAALFTIARTWKQPRCLSTDEWVKNCGTYTHWNITQP